VRTRDGATLEGRLRWGGGEEAFWTDAFNGWRPANPWAAEVPAERLPQERVPIELFGLELFHRVRPVELGRNFMARFGDLTRIEARGRDVLVTLKSGTLFVLDRNSASDFDDGVRVWDARRGVLDLDSLRVAAIDLLPTAPLDLVPGRLHGTVRSRQGEFTGFLQWDREEGVGSDELDGRSADGDVHLRYDSLAAIARRSGTSAVVTRLDGGELELFSAHGPGRRNIGPDNRGVYVDDSRYGRVLVSWEAFERVDFSPGGGGPAYLDFPPGRRLAGTVTRRGGERHVGALVFDLDESETTETLDAPAGGVDYSIPFGRIAAIAVASEGSTGDGPVRVTLADGASLDLERSGDLGDGNPGLLVFVEGRARPEFVAWSDVARVELEPQAD
jgi:hypothetical protein